MSENTTGWSLWDLERRKRVRLATDGKTPLPSLDRETINGAPVDNRTHEFVMKKNNAPDN